jgi:hypothetical protein
MIEFRRFFDSQFYRHRYGFVGSDEEAYRHYVEVGCIENRSPSPHFSPGWFSRTYPEASGSDFLYFMAEHPKSTYPNHYWQKAGWAWEAFVEAVNASENIKPLVVIGLFGTGRTYFSNAFLSNPTLAPLYQEGLASCGMYASHSVICSGHATLKHESSFQMAPDQTGELLLRPLSDEFHCILFVKRHPVDSLFSNWAWWRRFCDTGIPHNGAVKEVFGGNRGLIEDIRSNLPAFLKFMAEGIVPSRPNDPAEGNRFLSFEQMLDESLAWMEVPAVVSIRFEEIHEHLDTVSDTITNLLSRRPWGSLVLELPVSTAFNYRQIFRDHPDIQSLVCAGIGRESSDKLLRMGYYL